MSEIRVDTISEKTSANGVAIDGLTIKDGGISATTGGIVFNEASADLDFRVESNGNTHMLFVDGGNNKIGVNNASPARQVHITDTIANGGGSLGLTSSDSSTSGSFGTLHFGNNTDSSLASIGAFANGATDAGALIFKTEATGGAIEERVRFSSSEAVFNEGSFDIDFRVESNGNANMLKVDGGNNRVGVGCDPSADFHVDSSGGGVIRVSRNSSSTSNFMALESDGTNGTVKAIQELIISAGGGEAARFTSGGLAIGGTGAANTLNDYEEGTYTPTVDDENGGSYGLSTNSDTLQYTKIGRLVTIQGMVAVTSESSPNGTLRLSLPFTAPSLTDDSDYVVASMSILNNGSTLAGETYLFVQPGSYAFLYNVSDAGGSNYIQHDEVDTNFQFHVNLSYVVS